MLQRYKKNNKTYQYQEKKRIFAKQIKIYHIILSYNNGLEYYSTNI